ncbi:hypothetical protein MO973_09670 [Paenibacillus sp. TRM 82003]|uniref:hypothetical protein n=1 Tax=Kineococcus sp. TRM81007 TaxID=2925831 RepID=UPI001F563BD3|nr:hypothetical protein [Kineococcus sp. TRM81007]MCI2238115.1 hypothetical protein [Kineococcus sp. TRM81007]MCI3920499.1 hypothetical protein [Paenibacillus sp. TRM 82003]
MATAYAGAHTLSKDDMESAETYVRIQAMKNLFSAPTTVRKDNAIASTVLWDDSKPKLGLLPEKCMRPLREIALN